MPPDTISIGFSTFSVLLNIRAAGVTREALFLPVPFVFKLQGASFSLTDGKVQGELILNPLVINEKKKINS